MKSQNNSKNNLRMMKNSLSMNKVPLNLRHHLTRIKVLEATGESQPCMELMKEAQKLHLMEGVLERAAKFPNQINRVLS